MPIKLRSPSGLSFIKRRVACSNTKFNVYLDRMEKPNGDRFDYMVVAPRIRAARLVTGVAVLPFLEGRIGLLRLFRYAVQSWVWEIPRGFIDAGENHRKSALRELTEETGLDCSPRRLVSLGYLLPESGLTMARIHLFSAQGCVRLRAFRPAEEGHRSLRFFNPRQIHSMILRSLIQDPSTITAFYRRGKSFF